MQIKRGVAVLELHHALRYGLLVLEEEAHRETGRGIVVTAFQDGIHSTTSLHYGVTYQGRKTLEADPRCRGADIRTRDHTLEQRLNIERRARLRLGPDFDLIWEGPPGPHWHLEYDPKPPES